MTSAAGRVLADLGRMVGLLILGIVVVTIVGLILVIAVLVAMS